MPRGTACRPLWWRRGSDRQNEEPAGLTLAGGLESKSGCTQNMRMLSTGTHDDMTIRMNIRMSLCGRGGVENTSDARGFWPMGHHHVMEVTPYCEKAELSVVQNVQEQPLWN